MLTKREQEAELNRSLTTTRLHGVNACASSATAAACTSSEYPPTAQGVVGCPADTVRT